MDMDEVLKQLDSLFSERKTDQVEPFLKEKLKEAMESHSASSAVTILNELTGFYRDTSQYDKSCESCKKALGLLEDMGLSGSVPYGTTLQNAANAFRAAGKHRESLRAFEEAEAIYQKELEPEDFRFASLMNNKSLLCQETGDFEGACACLRKALSIVSLYPEAKSELAVTCANLGASLLRCKKNPEALEYIQKALAIFEEDGGRDFHYSAALSAMGDACYLEGNFWEAADFYGRAMEELEKHVGRTEAWERARENRKMAWEQLSFPETGLALCRQYYETFGAPMIHEKFPEYEGRIAAGLAGEGSDCFGYDDALSRDHDFGPRFCLWLTDEDYAAVGEALKKAYEELPDRFGGISRKMTPGRAFRHGVMRIGDFYRNLTGKEDGPVSFSEWLDAEEEGLAAAVNGSVFRDDLGEFSRVRSRLKKGFPEAVRLLKLSEETALFLQAGPYNYNRLMSRGEWVGAGLEKAAWAEHLMKACHLLNGIYAPYRKWLHKSARELPRLGEIGDILSAAEDMGDCRKAWEGQGPEIFRDLVNGEDQVSLTMELVNALILDEMKKKALLPASASGLPASVEDLKKRAKAEQIAWLEWEAFDKVKNEGGRAFCQDDWETFHVMRLSQYLTWPWELLDLWCLELMKREAAGRNSIMEKYARMMASTAPEEYETIKDSLPPLEEKQKAIVEEIVRIQVSWMEDFAGRYPGLASNTRKIHTSEDKPWDTSFETYLRGELLTYPPKVLEGYGRMTVAYLKRGANLTEAAMEWTARLYGYASLEEAEEKIKQEKEME